MPKARILTHIPTPYLIFLLYIEPLSTLLGAYYAYLTPHLYLSLTHAASTPLPSTTVTDINTTIPLATRIALSQLANLYILFALNEGLVLRCTRDAKVWRTLLVGLLVADLGHLWTSGVLAGPDAAAGMGGMGEAVGKVEEVMAMGWNEWMMRGGQGGGGWGSVYWEFWKWNSMGWGNVAFVYVGVTMRVCFLLGVGLKEEEVEVVRSKKE